MNNLYLIIGEDNKLVNFYLNDILSKIDYVDNNKINYDMNINNFEEVLDEASMISLFSSIKVIVVNNFDISKITDNEMDYLVKYINNKNKDVYIILIANKIDGRSKSYKIFKEKFSVIDTVKVDNKLDMVNYVKEKISLRGYKIDSMNIEYFISRVGNDINNINNELEKLFIYKDIDKKILREDIKLLITDSIDNIIYEFTNAFFDRDYDKLAKMYNDFKLENVSIDYLVISLANSFRQALIMKILYNDGNSYANIAKVIGKKEFYVKKMLERLYVYTINDLAKFIDKLAMIDREYKSGRGNMLELELFLFCKDR